MKICKYCNINKEDTEFRIKNKNKQLKNGNVVDFRSNQCYECEKIESNNRNKALKLNLKQKLVNYKGGKCERCGYNECLDALDFHHKDPFKKEFAISSSYNFEKSIIEVDKCSLLCKNCHTKLHKDVLIKNPHSA